MERERRHRSPNFIADLLPEDEEGGLDAIADPEEVLQAVDDGDLAEIVSNLDYH